MSGIEQCLWLCLSALGPSSVPQNKGVTCASEAGGWQSGGRRPRPCGHPRPWCGHRWPLSTAAHGRTLGRPCSVDPDLPPSRGAQAVSPQRPSAQPEVSPQSEGEGCPQRAGPGSRPHGGRCGGGGSRPQCSRQGSPSTPGRTCSGPGHVTRPRLSPAHAGTHTDLFLPHAAPGGRRSAAAAVGAASPAVAPRPPRQPDERVRGATPPAFGAVTQKGRESGWGQCPVNNTLILWTPGGWASAPRRPRARPPPQVLEGPHAGQGEL